jgi:hypothetical protein
MPKAQNFEAFVLSPSGKNLPEKNNNDYTHIVVAQHLLLVLCASCTS